MYYKNAAVGIPAVAALIYAAWWSAQLARADAYFRQETPEAVARAVELAPLNTDYATFAALQNDYEGKDARSQLESVAQLNPRLAAPRIRLGLAAEIGGDAGEAERWLLEAAAIDRQFETRWTLANFYFRQERDEFWTWMQSALAMSYGDRKPAFDLCWRKSSNAAEILERAIPNRAEVGSAYLSYLLGERRLDAVAPAASRLANLDAAGAQEPLLEAVDALLDAGMLREAAGVWRATGRPAPSGVSNPHFEQPNTGHGFDWRFARQQGVTHLALDAPAGHRVRLSGTQSESVELFGQVVGGLRPGASYRLRWRYRKNELPAVSGIEWQIAGRSAPVESEELIFTTPVEATVLQLHYRRPVGEVRAEGSVDLWEVAVEEQR